MTHLAERRRGAAGRRSGAAPARGRYALIRRRIEPLLVAAAGAVALATLLVTAATAVRTLARTEAQRAADAGALAGAASLVQLPDERTARTEAIAFARRNAVLGRSPNVRPEDVEVDVRASTVRVRVRAASYAIPGGFARALGAGEVHVVAVAVAEGRSARDGLPIRALRLVE